jgi:hypothetical protein
MSDIDQMAADWISEKAKEKSAVERRRAIEDSLVAMMAIRPDAEGTTDLKADNFVIKAVGRLDRKIDAEKVQEIAMENGTYDHLAQLFRWRPEINMAVWKATAKEITNPLLAAITTTAGRPSFTIKIKE